MAARRPADSRPSSNERLLVEAAQKDPARFADLYELHFEVVYAFIIRRVRDRSAAEDLASEVFHRAIANLKSYEVRGAPFGAWLIRIAANLVADHVKKAAREIGEQTSEPSSAPNLEQAQDSARLFRLVEQLPEDQRRVIFERFVEQRSIQEIAKQLGKSEGAVKQLQFRAVQSLRAEMEGANG